VSAEYRHPCYVSYETEDGWSDDYKILVTFVTGLELNQAIRSVDYDSLRKYALLWFAQDKVAIVELDENVISGVQFSSQDFRRAFLLVNEEQVVKQVNGTTPRTWKIRSAPEGGTLTPKFPSENSDINSNQLQNIVSGKTAGDARQRSYNIFNDLLNGSH
jgi:hypothetical protein